MHAESGTGAMGPLPCIGVLSLVVFASTSATLGPFPLFVNRHFAYSLCVVNTKYMPFNLISPLLPHAYIVHHQSQSHHLKFCYSRGHLSTFKKVSLYPITMCYIIENFGPPPESAGCNRLSLLNSACIMHLMQFFSSEQWIKDKSNNLPI